MEAQMLCALSTVAGIAVAGVVTARAGSRLLGLGDARDGAGERVKSGATVAPAPKAPAAAVARDSSQPLGGAA